MKKSSLGVTIILLAGVFVQMSTGVLLCQPNQKLRSINGIDLCCYTVKCYPGQIFHFCTENNGYDTCQNCPTGFTHRDNINTADWDDTINPCIEIDDCKGYSDLAIINGICSCDRSKGYYGKDTNKCALDDNKCIKAGYELTVDGDCRACDDDHFKADHGYALCKEKTRCSNGQEVDDPGSHVRDRKCRVKTLLVSTNPPAVSKNASIPDGYKQTENIIPDKTPKPTIGTTTGTNDLVSSNKEEKQSDNNLVWIIVVVVFLVVILACLISVYCYMRRISKGQHQSRNLHINCCMICCVARNEVHLTAENLQAGNHNTIKKYQSKDDSSTYDVERNLLEPV